jgi:hypothetical protein
MGARAFLDSDADYLLHVDDDIGADATTVLEMLSAEPDVVFAAYRQRFAGGVATVHPLRRAAADGKTVPLEPDEWPMRRTPSGARIYSVHDGGLGLCLVARRVIETLWTLRDVDPAFYAFRQGGRDLTWIYRDTIDDAAGEPRYVGEDCAFMRRARSMGFRVECLADCSIDHDGLLFNLGREIDQGHLRTMEVA